MSDPNRGTSLNALDLRGLVAGAPSAAEANAIFWTSYLSEQYHGHPELDADTITRLGQGIVDLTEAVAPAHDQPLSFEYTMDSGPVGTLLSVARRIGLPENFDWRAPHRSWLKTLVTCDTVIVQDLTPTRDTFSAEQKGGKPQEVSVPPEHRKNLAQTYRAWPLK